MELRDLRYFCMAAELEHVTKAADRLNIAQPHLTRIIHQLEEEAGGPLFDRRARRIYLNPTGEVFYRHAKNILADVDALHDEMDYIFDRKHQSITLMCNTETFAPRMLRAFREAKPEYSLTMLYASTKEIAEALSSGAAQFALSNPAISSPEATDMIESVDVLAVRGCCLMPPGHPLLAKGYADIDDLRAEKLITMPKSNAIRNPLQIIFDAHNYLPDIALETNSISMIIEAVQGGMGFAFLTELALADYPELKPQVLPLNILNDVGYYSLSYNKYKVAGKSHQHFKGFIIDFFRELRETINDCHVLD